MGACTGQKSLIQALVAQEKRHVHAGAAVERHLVLIELRAVNGAVQQLGFGQIAGFHGGHATLALEPLEHQAGDVNRVGGWRVVHRLVACHRLVVKRAGAGGQGVAQQVVTHHHQRQPGGAQVLLRAAKCQAQFGPVHRARGHMGRKVNHQRCVTAQGLEVGQGVVLHAIDRLVRANMHIFGITAQLPTGGVGQAGVAGGGIAGGGVNGAVTARLLQRLLAPTAGDDKVCCSALRQVQRNDGVFSQATALHEQNLKVIRHRQ